MHNDPRKDIFNSIYPDVDPTQNFPLTIGERLSLALSVGVFMFGGVSGSLLIAGIGLTFVVACSFALSQKTPRRIRAAASRRTIEGGRVSASLNTGKAKSRLPALELPRPRLTVVPRPARTAPATCPAS